MLKDEALRFFDPWFDVIKRCVGPACDLYNKEYSPEVRAIHTTRTKANIIRDHMVDLAFREFSNLAGVKILLKRGYFLILLKGKALLRFKKLGRNRRSSNYPTKQARDFANGRLIPDIPSAARFDVGYVPNALNTTWKTVSIACLGLEPYTIDIQVSGTPPLANMATPEITPRLSRETQVRPRTGTEKPKKKTSSDDDENG